MSMRQSACGCWQSKPPKRTPWYYKPGDWNSWKPVSLGGDEWCRRTLVIGLGWITGVLVVPLRECRGCEDCGPNTIDGVVIRMEVHDPEVAEVYARVNRGDGRRYNLDEAELELGADAPTDKAG